MLQNQTKSLYSRAHLYKYMLGILKKCPYSCVVLMSGCPRPVKTWNLGPTGNYNNSNTIIGITCMGPIQLQSNLSITIETIDFVIDKFDCNSIHLFSKPQLFLFALLVTLHYLLASVKEIASTELVLVFRSVYRPIRLGL